MGEARWGGMWERSRNKEGMGKYNGAIHQPKTSRFQAELINKVCYIEQTSNQPPQILTICGGCE